MMRLELTTFPLAIDIEETPELRIQGLITENPAVIFSRPSCCMCHVMKNLLHTIGVHPTIIDLDDHEILAVPGDENPGESPALLVGGTRIGGLECLVALHLSNQLVPLLVDAGALSDPMWV